MFRGKAPLRLATQKSRQCAPLAPMATAARRWPVARDRSPAWLGTCSEGFLCALVARTIFLPQDVHILLSNMIAVAGGGTNAKDVSKNVRAWRCTRCLARLQACCPGGGQLLLIAWASEDIRQVLLQQPYESHHCPILEGLLSRYRLARGAFASCCRSFMFMSFAWLRWCAYGAPARLADSTSWISCFATTRWSVVTLDPGKKADEHSSTR